MIISRYHTHALSPIQCSSTLVQTIHAPLPLVWSVVRRFNHPQAYKSFISSCDMLIGTGDVGSVREVRVVSGLPAENSTERLDDLDDVCHVMRFSIVGGEHRLANYQSTLTLHESEGGDTVAIESYVVDVLTGCTTEETCLFTDTIVRCNLKSLAHVTEVMALSCT